MVPLSKKVTEPVGAAAVEPEQVHAVHRHAEGHQQLHGFRVDQGHDAVDVDLGQTDRTGVNELKKFSVFLIELHGHVRLPVPKDQNIGERTCRVLQET